MNIDFTKGNGLVPVIVQDEATLQVLMLGYMNEAALKATRQTGKVTFYSRSRMVLWKKGETSGNYLQVKNIHVDWAILLRPPKASGANPYTSDGTPSPEVTVSNCRVPSQGITQGPWYSLPVYLCRFTVRSPHSLRLEVFLGSME